MADTPIKARVPHGDGTTGQTPANWVTRLTSFLLVATTLLIGALSVLFLSATLAQSRLSSITIDGVNLNIWKLAYVGQQWVGLRKLRETKLEERARLEAKRGEVVTEVALAEDNWRLKWVVMGPLLDLLSQRVQKTGFEFDSSDTEHATGVIEKVLTQRAELQGKHPDLGPLLDRIEKLSDDFAKAHEQRAKVRQTSTWVLLGIGGLVEDVKSTDERLGEIFVSLKPNMDVSTRSRVENAFYELFSGADLRSLWRSLVMTQPDTLTLWLVLLMGVLGSSLQVTHAFFKTGVAAGMGAYLLRLSVGALAALIIFIVAKGGVPVVADFSRLGGDAAINPYFVSFLAIISGLLSENAIANIQAQGTRFFGQAGAQGQNRWTRRDVTSELQQAKIEMAELAQYFGESEERAAAMVKGEAPMTPAQQQTLALALRSDRRDLYTDIAPPKKS